METTTQSSLARELEIDADTLYASGYDGFTAEGKELFIARLREAAALLNPTADAPLRECQEMHRGFQCDQMAGHEGPHRTWVVAHGACEW